MTNVLRSDVFVRDEKGPEWFDEFLKSLAKPGLSQDIMSTIYNVKSRTVESVVQDYRKQVGLDILISESEEKMIEKEASFKPISIRHFAKTKSVIDIIKKDEKLQKIINSLCEHSGGNRSTPSIIKYLRDFFGDGIRIDFNDKELVDYINSCKNNFKEDKTEDHYTDVGLIGLEKQDNRADSKADYATYNGAK